MEIDHSYERTFNFRMISKTQLVAQVVLHAIGIYTNIWTMNDSQNLDKNLKIAKHLQMHVHVHVFVRRPGKWKQPSNYQPGYRTVTELFLYVFFNRRLLRPASVRCVPILNITINQGSDLIYVVNATGSYNEWRPFLEMYAWHLVSITG